MAVRARYEYSGLSDYWGGNGRRWDNDAGCLFAFYGCGTTLADIVESLCEDYWSGGDCDDFPGDVTQEDIREAIMRDMLNDRGRADVASGEVAECAANYASINDLDGCRECGESVGDEHGEDCETGEGVVVWDDCNPEEDMYESPIFVALVEIDVCPECGCYVEDEDEFDNGLCSDCAAKDLTPDGEGVDV